MLPMPKALCLHAVKSCWIMRAEHKLPDAYELDDSQQKKSKNTLEKNTLLQILLTLYKLRKINIKQLL